MATLDSTSLRRFLEQFTETFTPELAEHFANLPPNPEFQALLDDQGKLPKVVITACMRKLLVILNTMIKTNSHWNPQFV